MALKRFSRHSFTVVLQDEDDALFLNEREPFRFRVLPDTKEHVVQEGDTLHHLAFRYYRGITPPGMSAAQLFWVIGDFQPQPILDPTLKLTPGTVLFVVSRRTVIEEVFNESRRRESNIA